MAATLKKRMLSGSTDGRAILINTTATPGTLIHTAGAVTGSDNVDELFLWAMNTDATAARVLTIEWGGTTSPNDQIIETIASRSGLIMVVPGLVLNNGVTVRAFASLANVITILGFVNERRA
jgi:hypothetical protein